MRFYSDHFSRGVKDFSDTLFLSYLLNPLLADFKVRPLQCKSIEL